MSVNTANAAILSKLDIVCALAQKEAEWLCETV